MDATPIRITMLLALGCLCLTGISCESLRAPGRTADWFARNSKSHENDVAAHKEKWQTRRDGQAFKWLLATQISNGLTIEEVNSRLGDIGVKEDGTQEFKQKIDGIRIDDKLYRFGPDHEGESYYLVLRDGKVVNFDSKRFTEKK
jgi:hypothetical protein